MFNNPFLKKDPLLEAVQSAMQDGEIRRKAEALVNEEFGVYSRKAVINQNLAAYDAAIEEVYGALKEGVQIDELKKTTLASYTKKAAQSIANAGVTLGKQRSDADEADRITNRNNMRDQFGVRDTLKKSLGADPKSQEKTYHTLSKRSYGIDRAVSRLAKEALDPVGHEDSDIDNDGKKNTRSDKYLLNRRAVRSKIIKMKEGTVVSQSGSGTKLSDEGHPGEYHERNTPEERNTKATFDRMRQMKEGSMYSGKNPFDPKDPSVQGSGDVTSTPAPAQKPMNRKAPNDPSVQGSGDVTMSGRPARVQEGQINEKAPPGAKFERMVKHIKKSYSKGGLTDTEKGKAYGRTWAQYKKEKMEEDSSFNSAQVTGKSVNEVAATVPAVEPPALHGPRVAGQQVKQSPIRPAPNFRTSMTGRFAVQGGPLRPTSVTGSSSYSQGGSGMVKGMTQAGQKAATVRAATLGGLNPMDRAGGPISSAVSKGASTAVGAVARGVARAAAGPVGALLSTTVPANAGEDEKARQAKFGKPAYNQHSTYLTKQQHSNKPETFQKTGSVGPDTSKFTGGKSAPTAAPSVRQSFKQAYQAARAAVPAGQDVNKAQFKWTNAKGVEGTYQAAAKKNQFVVPSKQVKTPVGTAATTTPATQAVSKPAAANPVVDAPKPAPRPKDTPSTQPAVTQSAPAAQNKDVKQFFGSSSDLNKDIEKMKPPTVAPAATTPEPAADGSGPRKMGLPIPTTSSPPPAPSYVKGAEDLKKAVGSRFVPGNINESVTVGKNKYRIV